jgi:glycosyltransferase involved in cell wall biosynthesis
MTEQGSRPRTIDVLICTHRRAESLARLIQSLSAAHFPDALTPRIHIVHNGQKKFDAPAAIAPWTRSLRVIEEPSLGLAHARNSAVTAALSQAGVEWLIFLDDDQSVAHDFFIRCMAHIQSSPNTPYAAVLKKQLSQCAVTGFAHVRSSSSGRRAARRQDMGTGGFLFNRAFAEVLGTEPPFDPLFNQAGGEDIDWYLRTLARNARIDFLDDLVVTEHVEADRLAREYQLRLARRKGYADILVNLKHATGCGWWFHSLATSILIWITALAMTSLCRIGGFSTDFWQQLRHRQLGKLWALFGRPLNHYSASALPTVIIATQHLALGGAEKVVLDLATPRSGIRPILFLYHSSGIDALDDECRARKVLCVRHQKVQRYDLGIILKLFILSGYLQARTFHSQDIGALFYARLLHILRPNLQLAHSVHTLHTLRKKPQYRWLMRKVLNRSGVTTIAVSEPVRSELRQDFGLSAANIVVIPNGIDVRHFRRPQPRTLSANHPLQIVSVSRISGEKRLDWIIQALARLQSNGHAFQWHHIGSGCPDERRRLVHLAREHGVEQQTIWHGFVADVAPLIAQMDVFVSASGEECHPVSVVEAAAAGLPACVSNIPPHQAFKTLDGFRLFASDFELSQQLVDMQSVAQSSEAYIRHHRDLARYDVSTMQRCHDQIYLRKPDAPGQQGSKTGLVMKTFVNFDTHN